MAKIEITKRHTFSGHSSGIFSLQPIGPTGFLSAGGDGQVVRWDLQHPEQGQVIAKVSSTVYALLVDNDRLLVGENSRALHIIDLNNNQVLRSVEIKSPMFAIARSGDHYLVGTGAGELFLFDLSLNYLNRLKLSAKSLRSITVGAQDIALGFSDNLIRIVDPTDWSVKYTLEGHKLSVFSTAYHPDTQALVSTGRDAHIRSWSTFEHYQEDRVIPAHMYAANDLVFHPQGKYFATCSMDKTVKIWDATTFALLKVIDKARHGGHTNSVNKLLWVDFDNLLVTCSDDRTIAAWDIKFN